MSRAPMTDSTRLTRHAELYAAHVVAGQLLAKALNDLTDEPELNRPAALEAEKAEDTAWELLDAEEARLLTWAENLREAQPELEILWRRRRYRTETCRLLARLEVTLR